MKKVLFIVGHKLEAQGASNFLNETEFEFNSKICAYVKSKVKTNKFKVVKKLHPEWVELVHNFEPDLIIELHCNSFHQKVYGCEALVIRGAESSIYEAEKMVEDFQTRFSINFRGIKEVSNKFHRGYTNLNTLSKYKSFIFEPCFANFRTSDSEKIIENWRDYGDFLAEYVSAYIGKEDKKEITLVEKMIELIRSWF